MPLDRHDQVTLPVSSFDEDDFRSRQPDQMHEPMSSLRARASDNELKTRIEECTLARH